MKKALCLIKLVVILLLFSSINVFSQEKSETIVKKDGKDFYLHSVQKEETIYSISDIYGVSVEEIEKENPDISILKKGLKLYIPAKSNEFIMHVVKKGQTTYSISKNYGVSVEDIQKYNDNIEFGLKSGQILKIPNKDYVPEIKVVTEDKTLVNTSQTDSLNIPGDLTSIVAYTENPCSEYVYKNEIFKIALLLPLYLDENPSFRVNDEKKPAKVISYKNSIKFYEFYEGALIALDSMRREGLNCELRVFDTGLDETKIAGILNDEFMKNTDLIIGPVYAENINLIMDFAKQNDVNVISPFVQNKELLETNNHFIQVNTGVTARIFKIVQYLENVENKNVLLLFNGTEMGDSIKNCTPLDYKKGGFPNLQKYMQKDVSNVIIVEPTSEVFITELLAKLNAISEHYSITVFINAAIQEFKNLELEYYQNLNIHLFSVSFANEKSQHMMQFKGAYKTIFKVFPTQYSLQGYDIFQYFLKTMKMYGRQFQFCMQPYTGLQCKFDFRRNQEQMGLENYGISLFKYDSDYELIELNINKKTYSLYDQGDKKE